MTPIATFALCALAASDPTTELHPDPTGKGHKRVITFRLQGIAPADGVPSLFCDPIRRDETEPAFFDLEKMELATDAGSALFCRWELANKSSSLEPRTFFVDVEKDCKTDPQCRSWGEQHTFEVRRTPAKRVDHIYFYEHSADGDKRVPGEVFPKGPKALVDSVPTNGVIGAGSLWRADATTNEMEFDFIPSDREREIEPLELLENGQLTALEFSHEKAAASPQNPSIDELGWHMKFLLVPTVRRKVGFFSCKTVSEPYARATEELRGALARKLTLPAELSLRKCISNKSKCTAKQGDFIRLKVQTEEPIEATAKTKAKTQTILLRYIPSDPCPVVTLDDLPATQAAGSTPVPSSQVPVPPDTREPKPTTIRIGNTEFYWPPEVGKPRLAVLIESRLEQQQGSTVLSVSSQIADNLNANRKKKTAALIVPGLRDTRLGRAPLEAESTSEAIKLFYARPDFVERVALLFPPSQPQPSAVCGAAGFTAQDASVFLAAFSHELQAMATSKGSGRQSVDKYRRRLEELLNCSRPYESALLTSADADVFLELAAAVSMELALLALEVPREAGNAGAEFDKHIFAAGEYTRQLAAGGGVCGVRFSAQQCGQSLFRSAYLEAVRACRDSQVDHVVPFMRDGYSNWWNKVQASASLADRMLHTTNTQLLTTACESKRP